MKERVNQYDIDPEDSDIEEDDDSVDSKKKKKLAKSIAEIFKIEEEKVEKPEKNEELKEIKIDTNPELDTEAPVEHLSEVEIEDISRTLAHERLLEIDQEEYESESNSVINFLQNVVQSGDIFRSETETITTPISPIGNEVRINDPSAVGQESSSFIPKNHERIITQAPEKPTENKFLDYLIERRVARLGNSPSKRKELDKRLTSEVKAIKENLKVSEKRIRASAETQKETVNTPKTKSAEQILLEQIAANTTKKESSKVEKSVSVMKKEELISLAKEVKIDGTNLKKIFESRLITEKGLRRILSVFLRGGNVKRALNREILQKQSDFEKDPVLRDRDEDKSTPLIEKEVDALSKYLKKKGLEIKQTAAREYHSPRPKYEPSSFIGHKISKQSRTLDKLLFSFIFILFLIMLAEIFQKL